MSTATQRGEQSLRDCGTNNWPLRKIVMLSRFVALPFR